MDSQPYRIGLANPFSSSKTTLILPEALHLLLQSRGAQCQSVIDADAAIQVFNKGPGHPISSCQICAFQRSDGLTLAEQLMSASVPPTGDSA